MTDHVRIVFTRSHSIGSLFLRTALWSPWSHCAIVDGEEVIEASLHGVQVRKLDDLLAGTSKYAMRTIPTVSKDAVISAARSQLGKPYDWWGVVGLGVRRKWQEDDSWFCSEFVAGAFALAGDPLFTVKTFRITPRDLSIPIWDRYMDILRQP